jgi:demethylmenaquinone methyltransferase/2-methoxy-6-polyprenyl-1,4-benzoquinol methylase
MAAGSEEAAMEPMQDMVRYYAQRAAEYERIYQLPERQVDLKALRAAVEAACAGRRVLDVACGTGYFSACAARSALSIDGVDANEETLALARAKHLPNASFAQGDAYRLAPPAAPYGAALCTFWWSHVPKARLDEFLQGLHRTLAPGAAVLFADNRYAPGSSTPIARSDAEGNTYQVRKLVDGTEHEVLKNFPTAAELVACGMRFGTAVEVRYLAYYWILRYRAR